MVRRSLNQGFTPADTPLPIFPEPPTLSSHQTTWSGIFLEHHHQPAYETPEYSYGWYLVSIHLGHPITVDKWLEDGQFERKLVMEGDIGIYPTKMRYRERCYQDTEFIDLYLEPSLLAQAAYEWVDADRLQLTPCFAVRDRLVQQMGLALKTEVEAMGDRLYAESIAHTLAIHLLRHYAGLTKLPTLKGGLPAYKLQQVIEYIQAHLDQGLSVEAIAEVSQLSPYHFSRLFKQSTGVSPYQFIVQARIDRAKQLLNQRQETIAEIAYQVGFTSQSHLTRHFKRIVGVTPKIFRS